MNYTVARKHLIIVGKVVSPVFCTLLLSIISTSSAIAVEKRFTPPSFNTSLDDFNKRLISDNVNIDFVVAQVLNNARLIRRAGETLKENAQLFRNQNGNSSDSSSYGATSGSVIIPPGTKAHTIIIINQNDGDSYAINR